MARLTVDEMVRMLEVQGGPALHLRMHGLQSRIRRETWQEAAMMSRAWGLHPACHEVARATAESFVDAFRARAEQEVPRGQA